MKKVFLLFVFLCNAARRARLPSKQLTVSTIKHVTWEAIARITRRFTILTLGDAREAAIYLQTFNALGF